jgi:hypothetical protein
MRTVILIAVAVVAWARPMCAQVSWQAMVVHEPGMLNSRIQAGAGGLLSGWVRLNLNEPMRAASWSPVSGAWEVFGPPASQIRGTYGADRVGEHGVDAILWQSSVDLVRLTPSWARGAEAWAAGPGFQVGHAFPMPTNAYEQAVIWSGTPESAVVLTPPGAITSRGFATDGQLQGGDVGYPHPGGGITRHAAIWNGTPESFVDLNPGPNFSSQVTAMAAGQQAGFVKELGVPSHAAIWSGTPESLRDLHPFPGYGSSFLYATSGTVQVGESAVPGFVFGRAGVWFGTPESFTDLHAYLPPGIFSGSSARAVFQEGNTIYIGGSASPISGGFSRAVVWVGTIPSPGTAASFLLAAAIAGRRRRFFAGTSGV